MNENTSGWDGFSLECVTGVRKIWYGDLTDGPPRAVRTTRWVDLGPALRQTDICPSCWSRAQPHVVHLSQPHRSLTQPKPFTSSNMWPTSASGSHACNISISSLTLMLSPPMTDTHRDVGFGQRLGQGSSGRSPSNGSSSKEPSISSRVSF